MPLRVTNRLPAKLHPSLPYHPSSEPPQHVPLHDLRAIWHHTTGFVSRNALDEQFCNQSRDSTPSKLHILNKGFSGCSGRTLLCLSIGNSISILAVSRSPLRGLGAIAQQLQALDLVPHVHGHLHSHSPGRRLLSRRGQTCASQKSAQTASQTTILAKFVALHKKSCSAATMMAFFATLAAPEFPTPLFHCVSTAARTW